MAPRRCLHLVWAPLERVILWSLTQLVLFCRVPPYPQAPRLWQVVLLSLTKTGGDAAAIVSHPPAVEASAGNDNSGGGSGSGGEGGGGGDSSSKG
mgnify:CR=1 FL=1